MANPLPSHPNFDFGARRKSKVLCDPVLSKLLLEANELPGKGARAKGPVKGSSCGALEGSSKWSLQLCDWESVDRSRVAERAWVTHVDGCVFFQLLAMNHRASLQKNQQKERLD